VVIPPTPEGKRAGAMLAQEGDRWTVTLISYLGNYAPTELAGFIESPADFRLLGFAKSSVMLSRSGKRLPQDSLPAFAAVTRS
jgi:hypothetical protein